MTDKRPICWWLAALAAAALASACGSDGGGREVPEPLRTRVQLESDAGDYIGQGRASLYTLADAQITMNPLGSRLTVSVLGDQSWTGEIALPAALAALQPGTYPNLGRYPFHEPDVGGLSWTGEGRGCNTSNGTVVIDRAVYASGLLTELDLRFEQHCEGAAPALHGRITWSSDDDTVPPGPVVPAPATLWRPTAGAVPAAGSFAYVERVGWNAGVSLSTLADAVFTVAATGNHLSMRATGDDTWEADFQGIQGQTRIEPGYYPRLGGFPFHNPVRGGLAAGGYGCDGQSWVVVDEVTYASSVLTSIDVRFEERCRSDLVRGRLRWAASEVPPTPGPGVPPVGLWSPAAGSIPEAGNVVHLESSAGDWVGQGGTYTYRPLDAVIAVSPAGGLLTVDVHGDERWQGNFRTMSNLTALQPGYYGDLRRYPFHNTLRGGLDWSGEGRGCNTLAGWFAVDAVAYAGGALASITLRFEQHCERGASTLRGYVRWAAGDTTLPPGPVRPPPAGLWAPAAGSVPGSGNYVHLESDAGDWLGGGRTFTYTQADALLAVAVTGNHASVQVTGDEGWTGDFQGMSTIATLEEGYYPEVGPYPWHNPVRGGLDWYGEGRGCDAIGWFVVDAVAGPPGALTALDLRFELRCSGSVSALHGAIHWRAGDPTRPPGPELPPPAGLWAPAPGSTPATGSFVYLESDAGDYIGGGRTRTFTKADAILSVSAETSRVHVGIDADSWWLGDFQGMSFLPRVEPGYYGGLQRYPFHNPIRGGLSWYGDGRGCNTLTGWFVVDAVTYAGNALTALDLRFEQHCEGGSPALHGAVHWRADDPTTPPGPVNPPPGDLWAPDPGATPASGSYVYLVSDPGDYIGGGQTRTLVPAGWNLTFAGSGNAFSVGATSSGTGGYVWWDGAFQGMSSRSKLEPGWYPNLQRYPFHNPTRGGLDWSGDGRGCNRLTGWFVVDAVTYAGDSITAIDLRFEQHCEGAGPALHGKIHWGS